jgi:hypothetical protein
MIAPNASESVTFELAEKTDKSTPITDVRYKVIDDLGATSDVVFHLGAHKK